MLGVLAIFLGFMCAGYVGMAKVVISLNRKNAVLIARVDKLEAKTRGLTLAYKVLANRVKD